MNLTEAFTMRVAIPEPVDYGGIPWGPRMFVGAGVGRVEGDWLRADIVPNRGGDWLLRIEGSDGAYHVPDIRHTLRTDDGALILLRVHGFMELNDAWRRATGEGVASDYGDHYLRAVFYLRDWFRDVRLAELAAVHRRGPLPGGGHDRIPHLRGQIAEPSNQRAAAHCTRTIERAHAPHADPEVPNHDDPGPGT